MCSPCGRRAGMTTAGSGGSMHARVRKCARHWWGWIASLPHLAFPSIAFSSGERVMYCATRALWSLREMMTTFSAFYTLATTSYEPDSRERNLEKQKVASDIHL